MKKVLLYTVFVMAPLLVHGQDFSYMEKRTFKELNANIFDAKFSPFRNYFAITFSDNRIEVYDRNWRKVYESQGDPESYAGTLSFSPDEEYLAFSKYKSTEDIAVLRLSDLNITDVLTGHTSYITDLAYNHDGSILSSVCYDNTVRLWHRAGNTYKVFQEFDDHTSAVRSVSFSYDDRMIATCADENRILIYVLRGDRYRLSDSIKPSRGYQDQVLFHPKDDRLVTLNGDYIRIWEKKDGHYEKTDSIKGYFRDGGFSFSPNGEYLAGPNGRDVRIWKEENGRFVELEGIYRHKEDVFNVDFSEDGQFLISTGADKSAFIWEVTNVKPSIRSTIAGFLHNNLTTAQKHILKTETLLEIDEKIDPALALPKDEFETTEQYNARRKKLAETTLALLQDYIEQSYNVRAVRDGNVHIPIQELVGYNADKQIYKIKFLETEAGVEIPIEPARQLKRSWNKAYIRAWKYKDKTAIAADYSDFKLMHPNGSSYPLTPLENPFHLKKKSGIVDSRTTRIIAPVNRQETAVDGPAVTRALLFATSVYDAFSELVNPVLDANSLSAELTTNYLAMVEVNENPTLNETVRKIREYATLTYGKDDQLLIFFAGHGIYDNIFKEGYVISRDSRPGDETKTSYLSHSNLRTMINNIPCNHIFLVMDVCFGGTFDPMIASTARAANMYEEISTEDFIRRKSQYKTRIYLTSGGKEYVPDGRPGHHSPFMRKFLEALRNYGGNDGITTVSEILQYVEKVNPQPRFGEFGDNEPGSDFLFIVRKSGS